MLPDLQNALGKYIDMQYATLSATWYDGGSLNRINMSLPKYYSSACGQKEAYFSSNSAIIDKVKYYL